MAILLAAITALCRVLNRKLCYCGEGWAGRGVEGGPPDGLVIPAPASFELFPCCAFLSLVDFYFLMCK